jgi:predicted alpha/beta superfamily hydrolase
MKILKEKRNTQELERDANLYIALPQSYDLSEKHYPVLYMHDGHNLFYPEDSYSGSIWDVEGCFDAHPDLKEVIIVALSCSDKFSGRGRFSEYSIFDITLGKAFGTCPIKGTGRNYLDYLAHVLKPEIDARFRTLSDKCNTAMMGSSMGGVISNAAAILYPEIYGRIACLSSAFYVGLDDIAELNEQADFSNIIKYYMDTGNQEEGLGSISDYLKSNDRIHQILLHKIHADRYRFRIIEDGIHHESAWKDRLSDILRFLFE